MIKRYENGNGDGDFYGMCADASGEWVRYDDLAVDALFDTGEVPGDFRITAWVNPDLSQGIQLTRVKVETGRWPDQKRLIAGAKVVYTDEAIERAARALAEALNGGSWGADYTESHKSLWRDRVRYMPGDAA